MKDYSWIRKELKHLINENPTDEGIFASLTNRISMFKGKLYKYFSFSQNDENHALDNLKNDLIYYSNPLKFNDPFDCSLSLSLNDLEKPYINELFKKNNRVSKAIIRQMVAQKLPELDEMAKDSVAQILGVSCFAERPDNILMWSHYADKHTGFCVEYDFLNIAPNDLCVFLYPAIYAQQKAFIPTNMFDFSDLTKITPRPTNLWLADWIQVLLTKSNIWEYESEWRSIAVLQRLSKERTIKQKIISKVYLGCKISDENEKIIREIAKKKNIAVQKYEMDINEYRLK